MRLSPKAGPRRSGKYAGGHVGADADTSMAPRGRKTGMRLVQERARTHPSNSHKKGSAGVDQDPPRARQGERLHRDGKYRVWYVHSVEGKCRGRRGHRTLDAHGIRSILERSALGEDPHRTEVRGWTECPYDRVSATLRGKGRGIAAGKAR